MHIIRVGNGVEQACEELLELNTENLLVEFVFLAEIVVQHGFVDAGFIGNFLHAGAVPSLQQKNIGGRLQNPPFGFGAVRR